MKTETEPKKLEAQINRWKWGIPATAVVLVLAYAIYFGCHLGQKLAMDAEKWGQFGDFFGGLLNPLVAFAAFYWLARSVKIQAEELKKISEEFSFTRKIYEDQRKADQDRSLLVGLQEIIAETERSLNEGRSRYDVLRSRLENRETLSVENLERLLNEISKKNLLDEQNLAKYKLKQRKLITKYLLENEDE